MFANATALSRDEAITPEVIRSRSPANENQAGVSPGSAATLAYWPAAVIGAGLLLSAAWSFGLLYAAFLLGQWLLN